MGETGDDSSTSTAASIGEPGGSASPGRLQSSRLAAGAVLGALLLVLLGRVGASWRFFDRFLGDDGWVLRVAQRVAAGELLYRDVAWDYGPLPIYALSALFRLSPTAVWAHLLDILLSASALWAVYAAGARLLGRRASLAVTSWAALLGSSGGLISQQLDAYTSAVAWGTSTALATAAAACAWVRQPSRPALLATCLFALLSVLSKPEFGLAGVATLGAALWLRRPSRRFGLGALALVASLSILIVLRLHPETLRALWRGYSGYDLIAVGSVIVLAPQRLFGSLLVAAAVGAALWWMTRLRSMVTILGLAGVFLVVLRLTEGEHFLHAAGISAQVAWVGVVPLLLGLGWRARRRSLPRGFWVLWVCCLSVCLRWFCLGSFTPVAAGPVALVLGLLVQHGVLHRPTPAGWVALAAFLLLSSLEPELRSVRKPRRLQPVATTLGTVRLPAHTARNIEFMRAALQAAPVGGLFVSGGGPGWYLVSQRPNPTGFDVVYAGIGTTEPEVTQILDDLRSNPPAVILFERDFRDAGNLSPRRIADAMGLSASLASTSPDGRWTLHVLRE